MIGIAYEIVQLDDGSLPLFAPMSEVAGRLAVQMGCFCLESKSCGQGLLLSGVPGVPPAEVTIIGGGISGLNAAHLAVGMGARVMILDIDLNRLRYIEDIFHSRIVTKMSNTTSQMGLNRDFGMGNLLYRCRGNERIERKVFYENACSLMKIAPWMLTCRMRRVRRYKPFEEKGTPP